MKAHTIIDRLGAYHDVELSESQTRLVEAHLANCLRCQTELREIGRLGTLLTESATVGMRVSPEHFAAQVTLRLPMRPTRPLWQQTLESGWRLAPWTILGTWAFAQAVLLVSGAIVTALHFFPGLGSVVGWTPTVPGSWWLSHLTALLARAGLADAAGSAAEVFSTVAAWGWLPLTNLVLLAVVTLAYWSWLASWWARRRALAVASGAG